MKRKPTPTFDFIEQAIARAIVKKEGRSLKQSSGEHYELIVNPFIYDEM